jgi:hypothetical protein
MRLPIPSPRITATVVVALVVWAMKELVIELIFGSAADWLKANTWLLGDFLSWRWSTPILVAIAALFAWVLSGLFSWRKEPIAIPYEGILWVHDGYYPKSDSPRARPECPRHRVPVFFFDNLTGAQRQPKDSDNIASWAGKIICVVEGHHTLGISPPTPAIVRSFGQIRQEAEVLLGAELRKQGQHAKTSLVDNIWRRG